MKIALVSSRYPTRTSPYNHMFVHERSVQYARDGHDVTAFVPSRTEVDEAFDGVRVRRLPAKRIAEALEQFDSVSIHLLHHDVRTAFAGNVIYEALERQRRPLVFFVHGIEVQSVLRHRPEDVRWHRPSTVVKALYREVYRLRRMRQTIAALLQREHVAFVFPSMWMRDHAEESLGLSFARRAHIIPNGIDVERFRFTDRSADVRSILAIRPLRLRGKYAVDVIVDTARHLPDGWQITLFGRGEDAAELRSIIERENLGRRLRLEERFLPRDELPRVHQQHGMYLAATRMDAQGVSMCEAMASGLLCIAFDNTAIPEFVKPERNGLLLSSYSGREVARYITACADDADRYERLTRQARADMEAISVERMCQAEVRLMEVHT